MIKEILLGLAVSSVLVGCGSSSSNEDEAPLDEVKFSTKSALGEQLFSDVNLSLNRSQSCSTCHNPDHGFIDDRVNGSSVNDQSPPVSLGDDGVSLADRNAPTAAYAAFSPDFNLGTRERAESQNNVADYEGYLGGQFWDGREADLAGQAGGPPTNPLEMGMPDIESVVARLKEDSDYVESFEALFGAEIFNDDDLAYAAMTESIAAFESSDVFYPFDSKYDLTLTGDYSFPTLSKAFTGKSLFFSSDLSCASCHQLRPIGDKGEIFTSFEYHNIGVPENTALREINGVTELDLGLFLNPLVDDDTAKGKFKVPTLRNVAVTAPYMHNGVFQSLEAVLKFYEHARLRASEDSEDTGVMNPDDHDNNFASPEISDNIETDLLANSDPLTDDDIAALECFLISLTDARYEHLLDADKLEFCGL